MTTMTKKAAQAEIKTVAEKTEVSSFRQFMAYAWVVLCLIALPETASANPALEALNWAVDLLTSTLARSAAIVALAVCGYMAWAGKMSWALLVNILIGMVLVFGGAALVDAVSGTVSG